MKASRLRAILEKKAAMEDHPYFTKMTTIPQDPSGIAGHRHLLGDIQDAQKALKKISEYGHILRPEDDKKIAEVLRLLGQLAVPWPLIKKKEKEDIFLF